MGPKKAGGGNRGGGPKKPSTTVPDSDYIVFGDDNKKSKKKKSDKEQPKDEPTGPPKPTVKQVIGGASWTGKLPVNLLSEHCQRQKWNRPEYDMRQAPGRDGADKMYRSAVTLSKVDPKTRETVTLPSIRLPQEHTQLSEEPTALEARHFAATYALFRICSMKNIHMTLPPKYRDLWKGEFAQFKKEDVAEGRAWKYDEDPFAAEVKRHEIQKSIEKRKQEQEKRKEAQSSGDGVVLPHRSHAEVKAWERAPKVQMGPQIRTEIEQIVRHNVTWNPYNVQLAKASSDAISVEVTGLGFRKSHVEEALEYCKDKEEVLEWLMIHVPEDDLPKWALPPSYSAGITLASGDLVKEAKMKSLARAGYSPDICAQALRDAEGEELMAARLLQMSLVPEIITAPGAGRSSAEVWKEEMQALEAVFGDEYASSTTEECVISGACANGLRFLVRFMCPPVDYPHTEVPCIAIEAKELPAYIRLSATKQAVIYAYESLLGEMMVYNLYQWIETALPEIIENPGRLSELAIAPAESESNDPDAHDKSKSKNPKISSRLKRSPRTSRKDHRSDTQILETWKGRQASPEQIKMIQARQRLPAWSKQQEILQAISNHQVTIISGETGSGKSTQVVQFVLDNAIKENRASSANLFCTQPRRVATLSLADRVSSERCSQVGDEVGYIIRGESKVSETTKITFMTTGVLLRRLQSSSGIQEALQDVSHIFIDEVHERSLDTDFLLALLRDCLKSVPTLKVVLMSATLDADIFTTYFGGPKKVALVHIEGRTFPVTDLYLDEVITMTRYGGLQAKDDPGKAIQALGMGINYDLIHDLVDCIDKELGDLPGSVLVFLPGTLEIERCLRSISSIPKITGLPLHASLLPAEQRKVFPAAAPGRRKVVASTNVAETSITIEDIVAVIDTGRVKETHYDAINNIVRLEEVWASQAACMQRRGRAGRVRAGICYKLYTRNTESKMSPKPLPEIQRVPLEQLCLSVKATGGDRDISTFLSKTLTPPESGAIVNAVKKLHVMGALEDNRLTALGTYLSMVPADLRCAKLLIYGTLFGVLEPCLTIASILTVRSPFVSPRDKREEANEARTSFPSTHGDIMLDLAAFDEWNTLSWSARSREVQDWCSSKFLSQQTLRDISSTRRQLLDSLKDAGMVPLSYRSPQTSTTTSQSGAAQTTGDANQCLLIRALIAGSLQPQIAYIQLPSKKYISSISGAKELDPEAKTIKFFVPDESDLGNESVNTKVTNNSSKKDANAPPTMTLSLALPVGDASRQSESRDTNASHAHPSHLSRIFIHPSSIMFSAQSFSHHATHLSYFTKMQTSKAFIRDLTPLNIYSLLLFGGKLAVDTSGLGLTVGEVWKVSGWARIGVLISRLRVLLDLELGKAIEGEGENAFLMGRLEKSRVTAMVKRLIVLNGQDV